MMTPILNSLPLGFRFRPTDSELILYLNNKVSSSPLISPPSIISEIDLYKLNPWELPEEAYFGDNEWFCFSPRVRKYPNGTRPNRRAATGYWKATGTDKPILSSLMQCVGVKKSLIFYKGRAPKGTKTNWIMHEYRLRNSATLSNKSMILDGWVLCRIRHKGVTAEAFKEEGGDKDACSFELEGSRESIERATQNDVVYDETEECSKEASLKDALEGIKRVLSLGALDEQQAAEWPNKRSCDASDNCIFDISSI